MYLDKSDNGVYERVNRLLEGSRFFLCEVFSIFWIQDSYLLLEVFKCFEIKYKVDSHPGPWSSVTCGTNN